MGWNGGFGAGDAVRVEDAEKACAEGRSLAMRIIVCVPGVVFAWCFYGFVLFVISIGYMNPRLPQYYGAISLFTQFLPLLVSIGSWLVWILTLRLRWLKRCVAALALLAAGTIFLQQIQHYLPPGPDREQAQLQQMEP
ncbi:hypothetical protein [Chromobacterium subtsugae]|uniref:hypothetical protein n=1 Tax=Chromobacterium subtsugae TaxID=251747 RepID=UPI000641172A|nr:hypothetical protein [Chromobacterium subtsugae]